MKRAEPPRIATWLLEHSALADRDDALAGDLLEEFCAGRSVGWYWRQAFSAFVVGRLGGLSQRSTLLLFSVLWSAFAPVWTVVIDRLQNSSNLREQIWRMDWPFMSLSRFIVWLLLNLIFIWAGLLLFYVADRRIKARIRPRQIGRSFVRALSLFLPVYFATFVVLNLSSFPGPLVPRRTMMTFGELVDLRTWAFALRVTYFITVLFALWQARPSAVSDANCLPVALPPAALPTKFEKQLFQNKFDHVSSAVLLRVLFAAGLVNTLIVGLLVRRLPTSHAPSFSNLAVRAVLYVVLAASAGAVGQWWYWRRAAGLDSQLPTPFNLFALDCASGWIWVPAIVLLAAQGAWLCLAAATLGSAILAASLRRVVPEESFGASVVLDERPELFVETLRPIPRDDAGIFIALAISTVPFALHTRSFLLAAGLLAAAAFQFVWKQNLGPDPSAASSGATGQGAASSGSVRRSGKRLAALFVAAALITLWALLDGADHRNRIEAAVAIPATHDSQQRAGPGFRVSSLGGFESIILWPLPPKNQIVAPLPAQLNPFAFRGYKPLIIRFNGPYWYFQAPEKRPGREVHQARGSPLSANIRAVNFVPLQMEAHQNIAAPIPTALCREIVVEVVVQESPSSPLALGLELKDSHSPNRPAIELGPQPLGAEVAAQSNSETTPHSDTARFPIPLHSRLRSFDEITVKIFSDSEHSLVGPKVAITQFELIPR
jgi:hypothetical protein